MKQQTHPLNPNSTLNHEGIMKKDTYKTDGVTIDTSTVDGYTTGGSIKTQTVSPNIHKDSSVSQNQKNDTQTIEERFYEMCLKAIRTNPDFFVNVKIIRKFMVKELKANDNKWREKIKKAMGKDEKETYNHTYKTLSGGISNIRVEAFTRNCFRKHIIKSLKENK